MRALSRIEPFVPESADFAHSPAVVQATPIAESRGRVRARGRFLCRGDRAFWARGVTYGTFGTETSFPAPPQVDRDFAQMAGAGINSVRVYTAPPRWLLDCAEQHGLVVLVGLAWEQHVAFLDQPGLAADIEARVRGMVRELRGHSAALGYAVGNEIPASIVRWHGARAIEKFIERLYRAVKREEPDALVTYVNFPTTEYLRLPFLDFACFNVYLESEERLDAYLARLHNLAGERPLLMGEIGLDSRRHGMQRQSECIRAQVRTAFASGCAGTFVFGFTDEWHRGGHAIEDWDFGITTRSREAKPALVAVRQAYAAVPFEAAGAWPRISVVVCTYNGARTLRDTLDALAQVDYPDYEVIVVDDGSRDDTALIAADYDVTLIGTENRGLSSARNTGLANASGEIVAYIDDDAYPDPQWLRFLARRFQSGDWAAVGGPNIAPPGDGAIAECVANAPGGPVHVLTGDVEAEHIPGCNMAFRRSALAEVGGFDVRYRAAGDDVDVCWRLQERGLRIGFHAAALVWHHRRNSIAAYWRQQKGYGKAEALLAAKWPERYNGAGHLTWRGRVYARGLTPAVAAPRSSVYGGVWGSAPYQSLYQPGPSTWLALPLMPEWYGLVALLATLSALGASWPPLLWAIPLLALALAAPVVQALLAAARARYPDRRVSVVRRCARFGTTFALHMLQPLARLIGRIDNGLTPWRRARDGRLAVPRTLRDAVWREQWRSGDDWLRDVERRLRAVGAVVMRAGAWDRYDLRVRGGSLASLRCHVAVEEHCAGRQLARLRAEPSVSRVALIAVAVIATLSAFAGHDHAWLACAVLAAFAVGMCAWIIGDLLAAAGAWARMLDGFKSATHAASQRALRLT